MLFVRKEDPEKIKRYNTLVISKRIYADKNEFILGTCQWPLQQYTRCDIGNTISYMI